MSRRQQNVLIEVSPGETRAAVLDPDGRLIELTIERLGQASHVGAIHLGRVLRVEKGMGGAFVEIGLDMPGFLSQTKGLHEGQRLVVQVIRDAVDGKGAGLTRTPVLTGRYLALTPGRPGITWSRRLGGRERARLEGEIAGLIAEGEGLALRSAAAWADRAGLMAEAERLRLRWRAICAAADAKPPALLEPAPDLVTRVLRDKAGDGAVVFDDRHRYMAAEQSVAQAMPDLTGALRLHEGTEPLFESACIEEQIDEALARTVPLPGGGSLVFDETEALTAIDVNMGGAGGRQQSDEALRRLNLSAAAAVARQIVLRNIAGLIVVDFVSMRNRGHRRQVVEALRSALREGPVAADVLGMTAGGLVEVTRQRAGRPLAAFLIRPPERAPRPDPMAQACAALRLSLRELGPGTPVLVAEPDIIAALEGPLAPALAETGRRLGQPLVLQAEPGRTDFDIVMRDRTR